MTTSKNTEGPWAVLDTRGEQHYGRVMSRHATQRDAEREMEAHAILQLGGPVTPDVALPLHMWTVARCNGEVCERVRYR